MRKKKSEDVLIEVELKKSHTHAGEQCKPGDKIKVDKDTADWLKKQKVISEKNKED